MFVLGDVWYYGSGEAVNLENKIGFDKHSQKVISAQSTDPTSSPGVAAATGSLMLHTASGAYIKTGAAATDWSLIVDQRFLDNTHVPHGWEGHSTSSLAYDTGTQALTVTYSPSESIWLNGKKIVKTAVESKAHANAVGSYFFYFNSAGVITASAQGGAFVWETEVPIASVYYNNSADSAPWDGPGYILFDERHTVHIPYSAQKQMHYSEGAVLKGTGFTITGTYSTATGSGTVADNSYGIDTGSLIDQDFEHSFVPLVDNAGIGAKYPVWYRIGSSNEWRWVINNVPYYGGTNINYNLNTAGTYSLAETGSGNYINMYAVTWNTYGAANAQRFAWIMGQASYSSLALAQGENITSLNLTGLPAYEILGLYRVTMRCQSTYDDTGKNTRIEAVTRITDTRVNITISYNPSAAAAVTTSTTNFNKVLSATDTTVQTALDTIDEITKIQDSAGTTSVATAGNAGKVDITAATAIDSYIGTTKTNTVTSGFNEQLVGHKYVASGNLIVGPSSGGNALAVEASNFFRDSNFEKDISNITCTTGTCSHSTTYFNGGRSLKVALSSQTADVVGSEYNNTSYAGTTIEVSCMVKSSIDTAQICAVGSSGAELTCANYDGSNTWKRVTNTLTYTDAFKWKVKTSAAATGDIYIDDCYGGIVRGSSLYGVNTITPWVSFTMVTTATTTNPTAGTIIRNNAYWRRVGDSMQIRYDYAQSTGGSFGEGTYLWSIPAGYTIDTAKIGVKTATSSGQDHVGVFNYGNTNANDTSTTYLGQAHVYDATHLYATYKQDGANTNATAASTNFGLSGAHHVSLTATIPIAGWSANDQYVVTPATTGVENYRLVQAANALTDRVYGVQFNFGGTHTLTKNEVVYPYTSWQSSSSNLIYLNSSGDPTKFYASKPVMVTVTGTAPQLFAAYSTYIEKNGTTVINNGDSAYAANALSTVAATFYMNAGDYFIIGANNSTIANIADNVILNITAINYETAFLAAIPTERVAYVKDYKANNTEGGSSVANTWTASVLNTIEGDTDFVSISSNRFTLQPGTYSIFSRRPMYATGVGKSRIYNITTSAVSILGSNVYNDFTAGSQTDSIVNGVVTITVPTTYELQYYCTGTVADSGLGRATNEGSQELYSTITIRKLVR
jgi:hypothetical protein